NRSVRGIPDDFDGEDIYKRLNIKKETEYRYDGGVTVGFELMGYAKLGIGTNHHFAYNNYKGFSVGTGISTNMGIKSEPISGGVGASMGINSLSGADIDASRYLKIQQTEKGSGAGATFSMGTGYNTRYGMKDPNFGLSVYTISEKSKDYKVK